MSSLSERIMKKRKAGGMAEDIMELPGGGIGEISGTLKKHIMSQTDIEEQKTWLKGRTPWRALSRQQDWCRPKGRKHSGCATSYPAKGSWNMISLYIMAASNTGNKREYK